MTIKNFAFFGIMASILGISAANADSPTAKRIASTHYVDEAVAPKQDKLDTTPDTGNVTFSGEGNAITGVSASGDGTVTFTKGTFLTEHQSLDGKQNRPNSAAVGNIAVFNANKDTVDSEKTFTTTVDSNSTNAQIPTAAAVQSAITTATADVSGKVDIAQGQPNANHIVITDASGNVTTAATIPSNQVSGLGTAATRDAGAFQAYADSTVGPGIYNVISDGNQVGKNLIKLDGEKQNKSDSYVPAAEQGQNYLAITPNSITVGKNLVLLDRAIQENRNNLANKQNASDSNVPVAGPGQQYAAISAGNNVGTNLVALDTALDDKEDVANKKALGSSTWAQVTDKDSDTKYPSMAVLNAAVNSATFSGEYEDMNNVLPDINATNGWTAENNCTDSNPCVLTMQSGGRFVWTNMVLQ